MFDPYYKWLAILPKDQPPNHYRLLGLEPFEGDLDVIEGAAERGMTFIRQYQSGEHAGLAAKLLNEIAAARLCLLKPKSKADYDAKLRSELKSNDAGRNDGVSFSFDPELSSTRKEAKTKTKAKPKRKQQTSSQGLWIAGAIGGAVIVVAAVVAMNSGRGSPPKDQPVAKGSDVAAAPNLPVQQQAVPVLQEVAPDQKPAELTAGVEPNVTPMTDEPVETSPQNAPADQPAAPVEPQTTGPSVDLLEAIDAKRDAIVGTWTKDDNVLRAMGDAAQARLVIPVKVPAEYKLTIKLARETGGAATNECLALRLPVGRFMADVFIDAYSSSVSGIDLDQMSVDNPNNVSSRRLRAILPDVLQQLDIVVRTDSVKVTKGDQTIIDWTGDSKRLWTQPGWATPADRIAIGSYHGRFRFEELRLVALQSSSSTETDPEGKGDSMTGAQAAKEDQVAANPPKEIANQCLTWKGRKYFISDERMTFPMAQQLATKWQGRLLTISSREEEAFLHKQGKGRYLWTSMTRLEGTKTWRDDRERPVKFTPTWAPGQPNYGSHELLTVLQTSATPGGGLHDASISDQWHACIEWGNEFPGKSNPRP